MSPEERDEIMEFILQSQSNAAERHREAMNRMEEFQKESEKHHQEAMSRMSEFDKELAALAAISRDLVEVARLHSKRLDRLDNLNP
jgi:hypothetical protein